jgi:hypothetical protein
MATIAAAAIAAGGAAYSGVQQSQAASAAAKQAGKMTRVPLPGYAGAVNRYAAQLAAENANVQPPSFQDWVKSGGQATFPLRDPGLTPAMQRNLGLVSKQGFNVPRTPEGTAGLTQDQLMFLAFQDFWQQGGPNAKNLSGPLAKMFSQYYKNQRWQQRQKQKNLTPPPKPSQVKK